MKITDILYSKVYANSQQQTTESITPRPATLIPTTTSTPIILPTQNNAVPDLALISKACDEKYGPFHTSDMSEKDWWCWCTDTDGKTVACNKMSQAWLNRICLNNTDWRTIRSWWTQQCECATFAKNADWTLKSPQECLINKAGSVGIKCTAQDLINNTCSRNINKTLGIRSSDTTPNPTLLLQDVVLGATSFVGTIIMVALVYLGFKAVLQWADDSDALWDIKGKAKNLIIWFLLVIGSYTIIRLVQYIARGF
jgi:hypothetical protein